MKADVTAGLCRRAVPFTPSSTRRCTLSTPSTCRKSGRDALSIDPGLNNPLSCHWYAIDGDGVVYVVAEHYGGEKGRRWHAERIKEISARLNWHTDGKGQTRRLYRFGGKSTHSRRLQIGVGAVFGTGNKRQFAREQGFVFGYKQSQTIS